jgi:hypothetical protein
VNRTLTAVVAVISLVIIVACILNALQKAKRSVQPPAAIETVPEWTAAHSLLLNIDYQFKTDTFTVVEGDDLDYALNLVANDWSIHVHKLSGFARAFITGKPTGELYQLIGDSDIFKWQKALKLSPSEPTYTIFVKDDAEHLRQDFTLDVSPIIKLPSYFPQGLIEQIEAGKVSKLALGNFYYISPNDIFMIHFVAPYPLGDRDAVLVETMNKMKLNLAPAADKEVETPSGSSDAPDTDNAPKDESGATPSPDNGDENDTDRGNGSSGNDDNEITPLPLPR